MLPHVIQVRKMIKRDGKYYCDTKDAATLLGTSEYTIRRLINSKNESKRIKAEKFPDNRKSYNISFDSLFEYAKKKEIEANFQANIDKLKLGGNEKKSLLEIIGKTTHTGLVESNAVKIGQLWNDLLMSMPPNSIIKNIIDYAIDHGIKYKIELDKQGSNIDQIDQKNIEMAGEILDFFNNQDALLKIPKSTLHFLLDRTKVAISGINIRLQNAKTKDIEEELEVKSHILAIQKIKFESAIRKSEKISSK